MSGTAKKSNAGKIILGIAIVIAGISALLYASMLRPFLTPKPLADVAPDSAFVVVSIDLYNAGNTGLKYIRAIGLGRFQDLMKSEEEEEEEDSGMPGKMVKLAMPWLTREVMAVAEFDDAGEPVIAVLVGSRNKGKAEKNFPKMLELIKEESAKAAEEESPEKAKQIRAQKIEFKDSKHDGVTLHCNENPDSAVGAFCWASTKRALVVSPSQDMLKTVVSSINGKRTERQKQLADLRSKDVPDNYLMYMYADSSKTLKALDIPIEDKMLAKEAAAVRGALFSISYTNLSPEMRYGLVLDDKKIKDTKWLAKLVSFEPAAHRSANRISSENSLMYLSVNNVGDMLKSALETMDKKERAGLEKNLGGVNLEKLTAAIGSEAAGSVIDVTTDKDGGVLLKAIGAMEVSDKDAVVDAADKILKSFNKKIEIKKSGDNVWEVVLPAHLKMPEGMAPVIGYRDRFLYASLDKATLEQHMKRSMGEGSTQLTNIHMTMNAGKAVDKIFNQMPAWGVLNVVQSFTDMYGVTEMTVTCTPRLIQASLVQEVSAVGVHNLPLEKLLGKVKNKTAAPAAAKGKDLVPLAGVIPAAPALLLAVDTQTSMQVMNSIGTALLTPERISDGWAFFQEAKSAMGKAPAKPGEETGITDDGMDSGMEAASQDWEAGSMEEFESMEGDDMFMDEPAESSVAVSSLLDAAKAAAVSIKSLGLLMNGGWYGGEFAMVLGGFPEREEDPMDAALFISASDSKKALATFEQIVKMTNKANIQDLTINDLGVKKLSGVEYRSFSFGKTQPGQLAKPMLLIAAVKDSVVISMSEPYIRKVADAASDKSKSFQGDLGADIPDAYAGYAYASGDFLSMMVEGEIESVRAGIEEQKAYEEMMSTDYSEEAYEEEAMDQEATMEETGDEYAMEDTGEEAAMEEEAPAEAEATDAAAAEAAPESTNAETAPAEIAKPKQVKSPEQKKLEQLQLAAGELKAVRGILFVKSFEGISPRLSLDILLHEDKVAGTQYISKLYQYQSSKHEVDTLIRTGDSILYMSISNLSDILANVNENVVMKSNSEGMVKMRKDFELMGTSLAGIAGALGSEAGFSLIDVKFDRETFGYIPKFIAAVEVRDFDYLAQIVEKAVALSNERKAKELYEGNVESLVAAGEHMAVERRGDNILAIRMPTLIQYGEDMRLLIGYSGNHAFISLNPEVLEEFMAGGKGKASKESATFKLSVNPQQARRFAKEILFVGAEDKSKPKAIRDRERAKGEFLLNVMGIVGKGQITVRALPDRVSLDISQDLDREAIVKLPHGQGFEWARGIMVEKNFEACSHALGYVKEGVFAYSYDQESMTYTGLDAAGANLPQYMPMFMGCEPGQCKGKVREMVEAACEAGSFKIDVAKDGSDFVVRGTARGSDCKICTTAYFQNFNLYGECLADPKLTCQ